MGDPVERPHGSPCICSTMAGNLSKGASEASRARSRIGAKQPEAARTVKTDN